MINWLTKKRKTTDDQRGRGTDRMGYHLVVATAHLPTRACISCRANPSRHKQTCITVRASRVDERGREFNPGLRALGIRRKMSGPVDIEEAAALWRCPLGAGRSESGNRPLPCTLVEPRPYGYSFRPGSKLGCPVSATSKGCAQSVTIKIQKGPPRNTMTKPEIRRLDRLPYNFFETPCPRNT